MIVVRKQFSPEDEDIKYLWWQIWLFFQIDCDFDAGLNHMIIQYINWKRVIYEYISFSDAGKHEYPERTSVYLRINPPKPLSNLTAVLIPSDRHFIFNNNHLPLHLCALSNLAVGGHSIPTWLAGRWMCVIGEPSVSRQIRSASSALLSRSSSDPASFVICVLWTNELSEWRDSVHLRLFSFALSGWYLAHCQRLQTEMTRRFRNGNVPSHKRAMWPKDKGHAEK